MFLILLGLACSGGPAPDAPQGPSAQLLAQLRSRPLQMTAHGRCRMDCRGIDTSEVQQLLVDGEWVPERTRHDGPCSSHAIEGRSDDGQNLRVVFAACPDETRVVTAIDLDTEHACSCP